MKKRNLCGVTTFHGLAGISLSSMNSLRLASCPPWLVLMLSLTLNAQQADSDKTKRFTSLDGVFRLDYSHALVLCTRDPKQAGPWLPVESCGASIPVCSNFDSDSTDTMACVAYQAQEMKGTNFVGAAFSVNALKDARNEPECSKVDVPDANSHDEVVNGVTYKVTRNHEGAAGHLFDGLVYRSFHNGKCYELDLRVASSNIDNYDPGTVKPFDSEKVQRALKAVLASFKFLK